jgi:CheY-like chemotaxis protein
LGLGLAIVKDLARLLEHRLEVHSTPGKGSIFAVHVPIVKQAAPVPCDAAQEEWLDDVPLHGISVLLIEDDMSVVEALELFLEPKGVQLLTASSADEALAHAQQRAVQPHLAIADYRLPQGEIGTQALQRVREAFGRDLPTLLLTGETSPDWFPEAQRMGCRVLYKPIGGKELLTHIRRLLRAVGGKK